MTKDELQQIRREFESVCLPLKEGYKMPYFVFNAFEPDNKLNKVVNKSFDVVFKLLDECEALLKEKQSHNESINILESGLERELFFQGAQIPKSQLFDWIRKRHSYLQEKPNKKVEIASE